MPSASILAIGTEVTSGQIPNGNASWLAARLEDLGVQSPFHIAVPDDRSLILDALELCAARSDWIFVTGGLGPTTDDFTREVVTEFLGQPLEFDEPSWTRIQDRLGRAGIRVAESNRQQCYFPRLARILSNSAGTANGFQSEWRVGDRTGLLVALPGPPREIAAVWNEGLQALLEGLLPTRSPTHLLTWQCIGKSEAELGEMVEAAVRGYGLKTGYRVHRPYVEVKIWAPDPLTESARDGIARLEQTLAAIAVARGNTDLAGEFLAQTQELGISALNVVDSDTKGILFERLLQAFRRIEPPLRLTGSLGTDLDGLPENTARFELRATAPGMQEWAWSLSVPARGLNLEQSFSSPFRVPRVDSVLESERELRRSFIDRMLRFAAETALAQAYRMLTKA